MRALQVSDPGASPELSEVPIPTAAEDTVLMRVEAAGVMDEAVPFEQTGSALASLASGKANGQLVVRVEGRSR